MSDQQTKNYTLKFQTWKDYSPAVISQLTELMMKMQSISSSADRAIIMNEVHILFQKVCDENPLIKRHQLSHPRVESVRQSLIELLMASFSFCFRNQLTAAATSTILSIITRIYEFAIVIGEPQYSLHVSCPSIETTNSELKAYLLSHSVDHAHYAVAVLSPDICVNLLNFYKETFFAHLIMYQLLHSFHTPNSKLLHAESRNSVCQSARKTSQFPLSAASIETNNTVVPTKPIVK